MHVSYKVLYLLSIAQLGNIHAQVNNNAARSAIPTEYSSYPNTIKNASERSINVKVHYVDGSGFGPISLASGSEIMLNEDFNDICNVIVDDKQLTQCIQKGRPVKLPTKTKYSVMSYMEGKKGPQLILQ